MGQLSRFLQDTEYKTGLTFLSEMIDMDEKGGVYAGPAVTVTFCKEDDAVAFEGENKITANEENTEQPDDREQRDTEYQNTEVTKQYTDNEQAYANVAVTYDVNADNIVVQGNVSAEAVDNGIPEEVQEDHEESSLATGVRAPLASEEDLTAPVVIAYSMFKNKPFYVLQEFKKTLYKTTLIYRQIQQQCLNQILHKTTPIFKLSKTGSKTLYLLNIKMMN